MTVTDRIFQNVAELSVPNFFHYCRVLGSGEMKCRNISNPSFGKKYQAILHGANGRKFVYTEGEWRLVFFSLSFLQTKW